MTDNKKIIETNEEVEAITVTKSEPTPVENPFDVLKMTSKSNQLSDLFDRYQKIIYLIDESGSMVSGMAPEDEAKMYNFTDAVLEKFRNHIREVRIQNILKEDPKLSQLEALQEASADMEDEGLQHTPNLIEYIVTHNLVEQTGIDVPRNWNVETIRKVDAVRSSMKKFVEQRFKKYADAQVAVFGFDGSTTVHCYAGSPLEDVVKAIENLSAHGSSTNITQAVERAIKECKRRPSSVGAHHIVLVSDGLDYGAIKVKDLLEQMKTTNICFDFIFVKGEYGHSANPEVVKVLKEVCYNTGGEYNEVSKMSDFQDKFLAVSNRRALPPARD